MYDEDALNLFRDFEDLTGALEALYSLLPDDYEALGTMDQAIAFLIWTGLETKEIAFLKKEDIDFENHLITAEGSTYNYDPRLDDLFHRVLSCSEFAKDNGRNPQAIIRLEDSNYFIRYGLRTKKVNPRGESENYNPVRILRGLKTRSTELSEEARSKGLPEQRSFNYKNIHDSSLFCKVYAIEQKLGREISYRDFLTNRTGHIAREMQGIGINHYHSDVAKKFLGRYEEWKQYFHSGSGV